MELYLEEIIEQQKITALLRSAVFLDVTLQETSTKSLHKIIELKETGEGRKIFVTAIKISSSKKDKTHEKKINNNDEINISFSISDTVVKFKSSIISKNNNYIFIAPPKNIFLYASRESHRKKINVSASGWGSIDTGNAVYRARVTLKDYSSKGLGLLISTQLKISNLNNSYISALVSSHQISLIIDSKKIVRSNSIFKNKEKNWFTYEIGCKLEKELTKNGLKNKHFRKSRRLEIGEYIRIASALNSERTYKVKIEDISINGLLCKVLYDEEINAFPAGSKVFLQELNIEGRIINTDAVNIRIELDLASSPNIKNWFLKFTEAFHPSIDTSIDQFEQAAISFASSGGTPQSFLRDASQINKFLNDEISSLKRDPNWIQTWIEKSTSGEVIGHMSCVRYGDNLWHVCDLYGSHLKQIHKNFSKKFLETFISYTLSLSPFPKTFGIWKSDHPYWAKMTRAIENESSSLIYESFFCYKIALLKEKKFNYSDSVKIKEITARDAGVIQEIKNSLEKWQTKYFSTLMGFDQDSFASPRLKSAIKNSDYDFRRIFITIEADGNKFLGILSQYPPGTSVQHHQETIWLLPYKGKAITKKTLKKVISTSVAFALKNGFSIAYCKVATNSLIKHLPKPMKAVISDPRMWLIE